MWTWTIINSHYNMNQGKGEIYGFGQSTHTKRPVVESSDGCDVVIYLIKVFLKFVILSTIR